MIILRLFILTVATGLASCDRPSAPKSPEPAVPTPSATTPPDGDAPRTASADDADAPRAAPVGTTAGSPTTPTSSPDVAPPPRTTVEVLATGEGRPATTGASIAYRYAAALVSGDPVAASGAEPTRATLGDGSLIAGVEAALLDMREGDMRRVTIPGALAWGQRSAGPEDGRGVPPGATIVVELELVEVAP